MILNHYSTKVSTYRPGTNTVKLILLKHKSFKITARFWCMILVCIFNFVLSIWSYPNATYIADANMCCFELT